MSQKRNEKIEREINALEAEFRERLIHALRKCAAGTWGLFGQNDHLEPNAHWHLKAIKDSEAPELLALGQQIEELRKKSGLVGPSALYARFLEIRGRRGENALGEARLARALLEELGETTP